VHVHIQAKGTSPESCYSRLVFLIPRTGFMLTSSVYDIQ